MNCSVPTPNCNTGGLVLDEIEQSDISSNLEDNRLPDEVNRSGFAMLSAIASLLNDIENLESSLEPVLSEISSSLGLRHSALWLAKTNQPVMSKASTFGLPREMALLLDSLVENYPILNVFPYWVMDI
jgi:hypothetical protein